MSYSIFRVQGVKTMHDLRGLGKHNDERISTTNFDIDHEKSSENIELISCETSYLKKFNEIVEPMKIQYEESLKTMRADRRKSFEDKLNLGRNDVAAEFLFTSDEAFFKGKSKEEIQDWAERSLEFLQEDIGISKENIIHATVHMDEKTPHLHVVAVPLVKTYDGRKKEDTWKISRKHFIPKKEDLTKLQDQYHKHMNECGFNLERGTKKSVKHATVKEFKEKTEFHKGILELAVENVVKANRNVQSLEKTKTQKEQELEKITSDLNTLKSDLNDFRYTASEVDSIEFKKAFMSKSDVQVSAEAFNTLKEMAKDAAVIKSELKSTKRELEREKSVTKIYASDLQELKSENRDLKAKNKDLENENQRLKRTLKLADKLLSNFISHFKLDEHFKKFKEIFLNQEKERIKESKQKQQKLKRDEELER